MAVMSMLKRQGVRELIEAAKREDLGGADVTTELMPQRDEPSRFALVARQVGVFCGCEVAAAVLHAFDSSLRLAWVEECDDGVAIGAPGTTIATIEGPLGSVLSAERTLLNFLQRLCGVATLTRAYVDAVQGTGAKILDTRKTVPGWRVLDKYAVRCGGGKNHRGGLFDAVLIKDNHLAGVEPGRLPAAVFDMLNRMNAKGIAPDFVEVEADSLAQVEALLSVLGIDIVLLDNFTPDELRQAVALRDDLGLKGKVQLEASGGITLETVRAVAEAGVERISVGAITHSAPALDLALERA
jgi:nicotinate-nucleotide pyrophosphorylase (carboxylating)